MMTSSCHFITSLYKYHFNPHPYLLKTLPSKPKKTYIQKKRLSWTEMTSVVPVKGSTTAGGGGSRWCPTPEQVMLLEGMYRGGLKTPTATQIQQITARLSVYGKIQGKNVFYWFQNHKARDRQKLRKKLMALYHQHRLFNPSAHDQHSFLPTLNHQVINQSNN